MRVQQYLSKRLNDNNFSYGNRRDNLWISKTLRMIFIPFYKEMNTSFKAELYFK